MDPAQGGVVQALKTIISGLSDKKISNEVVCMDNVNSSFLNGISFVVHALGTGKTSWNYNKRVISWMMANLTYFDVVIVHGLWHYPGYATRVALQKLAGSASGILLPKLMVMPHGMLDPYFQRAAHRKLKAVRNTLFWKLIEKKLINSADALLFTSDEEMTLANLPFRPYRPKKSFVVGLGVEPPPPYTEQMKAAFDRSCEGLNNSPYILFLGRLDEKKGVDLMIPAYAKALAAMETQQRNIPILGVMPKLVIAGPGLETAYGRKLKQMIMETPSLRSMVLFSGMLTGDAKWGAFYQAEAFILPSHQENFGVAVVEALSCGVPVLISNQVNIWREINEAGGCYVSGDTVEGTFKLFEFWNRSSYKQKQAMSRNALLAFNKYFSTVPAAKRLLKAMSETIKSEPPAIAILDEN
ncbi:MAG TPA: glycosyltransferase [Pedobacter sp.]|nr:glycosyltransferase [Pedobacter sp.]